MSSWLRWARAGWGKSGGRATSAWAARSPSRSFLTRFPPTTDARRVFEREARAASALNHPNIGTIYDIGSVNSVSWIAMERVEGKTLRDPSADGQRFLTVSSTREPTMPTTVVLNWTADLPGSK